MPDAITWTPVTVSLDALDFWARNPKRLSRAQAARLEASTDRLGRAGVLLIGPADAAGRVPLYDGHQRANVWRTLYGLSLEVHALQSDRPLTEDERLSVSLLTVTATGSLDFDALAAWDTDVLQSLGLGAEYKAELDDTAANIAAMLDALTAENVEPVDAEPQVDRAEELREKWGVELGDLWELDSGKGYAHRLICGDCTDKAVVEKAFDIQPEIMVTDPPYGVEYDPSWRADAGVNHNDAKMGKVENDDIADWTPAWQLFDGDVAYVYHAGIMSGIVQRSLESCGFIARSQIIWNKDRMALSRGDYHWKHEPCWYVVRKGKLAKRTDDRTQVTVWDIPARDDSGHGHGTQKPIECMERPIRNHNFEVVYDPFLGSGTTLIACERLGRKCRAVEISPAYVAVALERWATATGKTPVRVDTP